MCKILSTWQGLLPLFDSKNIQNQRGHVVYLGSHGRCLVEFGLQPEAPALMPVTPVGPWGGGLQRVSAVDGRGIAWWEAFGPPLTPTGPLVRLAPSFSCCAVGLDSAAGPHSSLSACSLWAINCSPVGGQTRWVSSLHTPSLYTHSPTQHLLVLYVTCCVTVNKCCSSLSLVQPSAQ